MPWIEVCYVSCYQPAPDWASGVEDYDDKQLMLPVVAAGRLALQFSYFWSVDG
jgi:hypothetical protein